LLNGLKEQVALFDVEDFYFLARASLVKDERLIDRFDRVFALYFRGLQAVHGAILADIPKEWLKQLAERFLTEEERAAIERLGGFEKLLETLRQRLMEQQGRHEGGSKWIGTAGTSPFGAYGDNPEGIRVGPASSRRRSAVKVWEKREFRDLDGDVELGTRTLKLALRRLRRWAREGEANELDLGGTIHATAANGGCLDLQMRPERHNKVKVLLLLDIGGSMDDYIEESAQLFSAARAEFKHLETFYFHNCPYEALWRNNRRRHDQVTPTLEMMNTYGPDWKLIFVGDATMSPYEITEPGGSVEHWNAEAGAVWMARLLKRFRNAIWINPRDPRAWDGTSSTRLVRQVMEGRMYPLTLAGLEAGLKELQRGR
ncbi:MAG TPA: VWA domain-containing protein, partial [Dongiaceae bacterium]